MSQSSSAIEEMLANIQSATQNLIKNEANVSKLAQAAKVGQSGLLEISAVMENIASQTNLLSMNATIKAAHAGEAGKDFAVVADEIRKLAESSSEQSKTINDVLKKIKDSIDKITASTAEVLQNFEAISQSVKSVTDQEANVRSAMEEQGMGNKTILNSIGNLNGITGDLLGKPISGLLGKYVSGLSGKPISGLLGKYVSVQTGSMDYSPLGCRLDPKGKLNSLLDILSNTLYT